MLAVRVVLSGSELVGWCTLVTGVGFLAGRRVRRR
jgi:hypothetical protein